ncbi:MAG TPA: DUF58 domain-containing protein [Candidatus Limnocylindrales bacterium]|nr:DUF58 domain-containing protein [Candidatus Limnocylindrales bacterium]
MRPRKVGLTGRGYAVAALGAALLTAGVLWRYPGVIGLGSALLGLAVFSLASVLRPMSFTVQRTVQPREVARNEECHATLRVGRPSGLLPQRFEALENLSGVPVTVAIKRLRPRTTVDTGYAIPTDRRGVHTAGPLEVLKQGAAGLAERRASFGGVTEYRVLPRILPVRGLPQGVRRAHAGTEERVEKGGTDLVGLREYVPGDDLRRLHWATSARTGTLMIREDADPSLAHLTVLLDDRASSYTGTGLEDAVDVAASLAVAAVESGNGVRLLTLCGQLEIDASTPSRQTGGRAEIVHHLAEVTAQEDAGEPGPINTIDRDVVVVVTGGLASLGSLVLRAGSAGAGVVAIVDQSVRRGPGVAPPMAVGQVVVLRGADSQQLVALWDLGVAVV